MGLLLSPDVKIRNDETRVVLFTVNPGEIIGGPAYRFLYPQQALILSQFNGQHNLSEIKDIVSYLFNISLNEASENVEYLLSLKVNDHQTISSLIIDSETIDLTEIRTYDPEEFIISSELVDMSNVRCNIPCSLLVLPTIRCYTRCIYCYADKERFNNESEFDLPFFKRLLKDAAKCGIETIEFSGGDFFCREDAFELIDCTISEGMYASISTKYPLSIKQIERLSRIGLKTIQISIDALQPDIIDKLVAKKSGYGKEILKTIENLGNAGIRVRTNTVLTPINIKDAPNLLRYLAKIPNVFRMSFSPYNRSLYRHQDDLFCSKSDIKEFEKELDKIKEDFPDKTITFSGPLSDPYHGTNAEKTKNFRERAFCTANRRGVVVLPNGYVTICEELYLHKNFIIGNLNEQTLLEVWNSPEALELAHPNQDKIKEGPCKVCSDFLLCHEGAGRCFRESLKAYGIDKPYMPDPRCPNAPVGNPLS